MEEVKSTKEGRPLRREVLVISRINSVKETVISHLSGMKCKAVCVPGVEEGLAHLKKANCCLVLLHVRQGFIEGDNLEFLRRMEVEYAALPVILLHEAHNRAIRDTPEFERLNIAVCFQLPLSTFFKLRVERILERYSHASNVLSDVLESNNNYLKRELQHGQLNSLHKLWSEEQQQQQKSTQNEEKYHFQVVKGALVKLPAKEVAAVSRTSSGMPKALFENVVAEKGGHSKASNPLFSITLAQRASKQLKARFQSQGKGKNKLKKAARKLSLLGFNVSPRSPPTEARQTGNQRGKLNHRRGIEREDQGWHLTEDVLQLPPKEPFELLRVVSDAKEVVDLQAAKLARITTREESGATHIEEVSKTSAFRSFESWEQEGDNVSPHRAELERYGIVSEAKVTEKNERKQLLSQLKLDVPKRYAPREWLLSRVDLTVAASLFTSGNSNTAAEEVVTEHDLAVKKVHASLSCSLSLNKKAGVSLNQRETEKFGSACPRKSAQTQKHDAGKFSFPRYLLPSMLYTRCSAKRICQRVIM